MVTAAFYPVNDTSLSAGERAYLQELENAAAQQNLEQDLRPEVQNLSIVFTVLAVAVVGLRFLARHLQRAPIGIDDWLILAALTLLGGNLVFNLVMISQGLGLHSGRLTLEELETLNQVRRTNVSLVKRRLLNMLFLIRLLLAPRSFIRLPLTCTRSRCSSCTSASFHCQSFANGPTSVGVSRQPGTSLAFSRRLFNATRGLRYG